MHARTLIAIIFSSFALMLFPAKGVGQAAQDDLVTLENRSLNERFWTPARMAYETSIPHPFTTKTLSKARFSAPTLRSSAAC